PTATVRRVCARRPKEITYPTSVSSEGQSLLKPSLYFMAVVAPTSAAMAPASSRYPMCTSVPIDVDVRTYPGPAERVSGHDDGPRRDRRGPSCGRARCGVSDVEAERPQLLTAVVRDLVGAPRRHPDPVDAQLVDQAVCGGLGLVLDDVRQRTGRRGQGHVDGRHVRVVDVDAVDQAEVDDVDAQFGVDDVHQGLADLFLRGRFHLHGLAHAVVLSASEPRAWAVASFHAIQLRRAHFTRAGYLETPANATASSRISSIASSGSIFPLDCISSRKVSWTRCASVRSLPTSSSFSTE